MTISTTDTSLRAELDKANPSTLPSLLQKLGLGGLLRTIPVQKMGAVAAADSYQLATLQSLGLSEEGKAATILRAYARTTGAAGTLGELAVQAFGATPADGQIAVAPNGDVVVLAASAYTAIDILYQPLQYKVVEFANLPVAAGILTLPNSVLGKVIGLLEAEALTGTVVGKKIILVPAAALPATTKAALKTDKATVLFNNATDAVLTARVKLAVSVDTDIDAAMTAASVTI